MAQNITLLPDSQPYFDDLRQNLDTALKAYIATGHSGGESSEVRPVEQGKLVLDTLQVVYSETQKLLAQYPGLDAIYEHAFGPLTELADRQALLDVALLEEYLFPQVEQCPLSVDGVFNPELTMAYQEDFRAWANERAQAHIKTQDLLKTRFDLKVGMADLACHCTQCTADHRTKLREEVMKIQEKMLADAEERLFEMLLTRSITDISNYVFNLRKNMERSIAQVRTKFKRSSLSKLETEVKAIFKEKFGPQSQLAKVYREKLMVFFNTCLVEQGLKPDMVSPAEYERFFLQQETGIWKPEGFIKREFEKFTFSVMALKRKDISSTILRDYLGQFWMHTEARKIKRKIIYHMGPTNSGKTYHAIEALCKAKKGCYLAPLRLLAGELYDTMNQKGVYTTLLTGEEVIETPGASHYSSTIEMARLNEHFDCAVIDEVQMLSDPQRGWAWTRALVGLISTEVHLCGDRSVLELVKKILQLTGDTLEVREYQRMTELQVMDKPITLAELERGDALIVFSRRNALKFKADLENLDFKVSIVYGRLSPEVRREQARKFDSGETDIIVSTDAIAMGMNLPVQRIVFTALSKYIDNKEIPLTMSEIKQIAGRAGRFNRFPVGYVTTLNRVDNGPDKLQEAIEYQLEQSPKAMVGPDLEIYKSVNSALDVNGLSILTLSEFLRLFNTMIFEKPFYCTDLKEMIELAEMVEDADEDRKLSSSEIFGFACAPVNMGLLEHVQYYLWILKHYVEASPIYNEPIDPNSEDIDYLETSIKCVELFQWLSRHFDNKNFSFDEQRLLDNKAKAVERLNGLLSEKTTKSCASCGCKLAVSSRFPICEACFSARKSRFRSERGGDNRGEHSRAEHNQDNRGNGGNSRRSGPPSRSGGPGAPRPPARRADSRDGAPKDGAPRDGAPRNSSEFGIRSGSDKGNAPSGPNSFRKRRRGGGKGGAGGGGKKAHGIPRA